jgi:hypothetical protein
MTHNGWSDCDELAEVMRDRCGCGTDRWLHQGDAKLCGMYRACSHNKLSRKHANDRLATTHAAGQYSAAHKT